MSTSDGPFIDQCTVRALFERRQRAYLWGQPYIITPRLIDRIFGDGRKLIAFQTADHRPNFYICRIDSKWSLSNWDMQSEIVPKDWVDSVIDAAVDQFGRSEDDEDEDEYLYFPAVSAGSGYSWNEMDWGVLADAPARTEMLRYFRGPVTPDGDAFGTAAEGGGQ